MASLHPHSRRPSFRPRRIDVRSPLSSSPQYQVWLTAILLPPLLCHLSCCAASAGWQHSATAGGDNNLHWSDPSARPAVTNGDRLSCGGAINCPTPACVCVCEAEDMLVFVLEMRSFSPLFHILSSVVTSVNLQLFTSNFSEFEVQKNTWVSKQSTEIN